jgi:hypothetical protein
MLVKEIIHLEESLLNCKCKFEFKMPFDDYIILDEIINKVENITNLYFTLVMDYEKSLDKKQYSLEERKKMIMDFNQKILNQKINVDLKQYEVWFKKYIELNQKN